MTDDEKDKPSEDIEYLPDAPEEEKKPAEPPAAEAEKIEPEGVVPPEKVPPQDGGKHLKEKLRKKESEIKHLRKELEELKEHHLRTLADTENIRKRIEREKSEYFHYALSEILLEFLGVLDNFERALQAAGSETDGKTFREGVELIYRMSMNLLTKRGVRPIEIKDGEFDPAVHHAVETEESDEVQEPRVTEELQKGYMLHGRLLRPALVKVVVPRKG
jgi:molecular chaperone GrpE